jgi:phospholipid/cholesterol/gamma-HCH transport system substrate-binding protein
MSGEMAATPRSTLPRRPSVGADARRVFAARVLVYALPLAALIAVAWVLFGSGQELRLHARFENAGQLVKGADVRVAGRRVGKIGDITLTDNGQADVAFTVTDPAVLPLHDGTHATIRLPGQASVAGRIIELTPGPTSRPVLHNGAVLGTTETTGIVDLDELLNTLDRPTRQDVRSLAAEGAAIYAGSGARAFNVLLAELNPAADQVRGLTQDLADDRRSLRTVLHASAAVTGALADRRDDLLAAVTSSGRAISALAAQRRALNATLASAPEGLGQIHRTLDDVRVTMDALRPTLHRAGPAVAALRSILHDGAPALRRSAPMLEQAATLMPPLRQTFTSLARFGPGLATTLRRTGVVLRRAMPILRGLRYYGADFILGVFNGLAGNATGNYDAAGNYARLSLMAQPQAVVSLPAFDSLLNARPLAGQFQIRKGLEARCPGSAAPPAPDGSNPWVPDPSICDPADGVPASVNQP